MPLTPFLAPNWQLNRLLLYRVWRMKTRLQHPFKNFQKPHHNPALLTFLKELRQHQVLNLSARDSNTGCPKGSSEDIKGGKYSAFELSESARGE